MHKINGEENDKLKTEFRNNKNNKDSPELRGRNGYEDLFQFELRPDWKVKSSHTNSYSYEAFLPNEESHFNGGIDLEQPNNIHIGSIGLKVSQKQETCFHTVQNEIANLFYDDFDISKNIFPLCCKTETRCKPKTTKCMSVTKNLPKCTKKRQELTHQLKRTSKTFEQLTPEVHHSVSNKAEVNVVIHVKCDHPEAREHELPKTISLYPHSKCAVTTDLSDLSNKDSKYNFSVRFVDTKTTEVTKYSIFNIRDSLNESKIDEPLIKRYENGRPNESPDDKTFGDRDAFTENYKDLKLLKLPQPLLPHDITVQITKSTHKPLSTIYPVFICQITPSLCKSSGRPTKTGVLTRSAKPGYTIWKKINLPKFWKSAHTTQSNGCTSTDNKVEEPMCITEKTTELTSEETVLDRVSCALELDVTEESSGINCEVSENSSADCETLESVTLEPSLNNTEQTDSEVQDENNEFDLTFGPIPIQCDVDSTSPKVESSIMSNIELDETLSVPCCADAESLQVQSSTECEEPSIETYQPYTDCEQTLMEADPLLSKYVSTSVTYDQPYTKLNETTATYDELNTESGQKFQNVIKPNYQKKTTVQDGNVGLSYPKYNNVMTEPNTQNILMPGSLLIIGIGPSTLDNVLSSPPKFGYTSTSTKISHVNLNPQDIPKSTPFIDDPVNFFFDKASEKHTSTISINKLIESDQSVKDVSMSASEAAMETSILINYRNNETTESSTTSLITRDNNYNSTVQQGSDYSISNITNDTELTIFPSSTLETIVFETPNSTESAFSMYSHQEQLNTIEEHSYKIDIENIIELNNNSLLFYRNHKWFITNTNHFWNFDEGTVEIVNDTFTKLSVEHSKDNNDKNKEIIRHMLSQEGTYNESEEVPFELFVQTILLYTEYNPDISTFEWSGVYFNLKEMIAMLRVTSFDTLSGYEWGSVNWMTIYRLVKESAKTTSHDENEYDITEADGSKHSLMVFSNGSSIWNNIKLDRSEILNIIQKLNGETLFFRQTMFIPYKAYDLSFISFVKLVFEQRTYSNVTYSEYAWESSTFNWDELLASLILINNTLTDINNLEISLRQHWNDMLVMFRNSKRHYYTDRTIYEINIDTQMKQMTVFINGTTDFDGKRVTLDEVSHWVGGLTVSEVHTTDVQHIINLGGGKVQFYWNQKWLITNHIRSWSFEDQTSALMNKSFFSLPEDLTVSRDSFQKLVVESSYNEYLVMPFELFSQSLLTAAKYLEDVFYQWSNYYMSYADILAMLRLSNFNDLAVGYTWGQINWYVIYDKVKQSPNSISSDLQAYQMLDNDGSIYPLIVFSNGTSIWKHSKLDLGESLTMLQNLNSDLHVLDISVLSFISHAESFLNFMTDAFTDRIHNGILYFAYSWKHYQFKREDLEAMNRILLHHYESKWEDDLSFSKIALPVLNSTKQVFPNRTEFLIGLGSDYKPLVVYSNGATEYDNVIMDFMDTVQQVEELKRSSSMVFKEDWGSELNGVGNNSNAPVESSSSKGLSHGYDFKELNNNPYFNVCYPINLGGGKVQFYMKNEWFITDGENIWPFEAPLTQFYINEMVKAMHQTFTDDTHLDKTAIQNLVDNKQTLKGLEVLVMPHELIIQQYLFFMKHLDQQVATKISQDLIYQREKLHVTAVQLLMALRLSAYNNFTTKEVELPWEKGKKLNWDWIFLMGKRSEQIKIMDEWADSLNTSYFDEFQNAPFLIVFSNFSSDWGGQRLELDEALLKVQKANEHSSFLPLQVNGEMTSSNESFEWLYKEALNKRFEHKITYSKYKWLTDSVSWFDILIVLRFPEANPEALRDNMFWKTAVKGIIRAWTLKYSDRIEYKVSGIDPHEDVVVTIYMNESTVLNGKKMDIEDYRTLL